MPSYISDEITNPFPNFNGCIVEVWEWVSNFTSHFTMDVTIYPYCGEGEIILVNDVLECYMAL